MTQPYNRFDLEEEIMNIWQTEDDLDAVVHRMMKPKKIVYMMIDRTKEISSEMPQLHLHSY